MPGAQVLLLDGPLSGETVTYGQPLPAVLVVADKRVEGIRWHDYAQTERAHCYRHSDRCPCTYVARRPVNLDVV